MKILITGADVQQVANEFQVIYQNKVVFSDKTKACAVVVALDRAKLIKLLNAC